MAKGTWASEITRITQEYTNRDNAPKYSELYSPLRLANQFVIQQRDRAILRVLSQHHIYSLSDLQILDVGCGNGAELRRFLGYGARPEHMCGLDILSNKLVESRSLNPRLGVVCGNGGELPFPDHYFNLVLQFTVFSSILDNTLRQAIANQILRVLAQQGLILWYDFWLNPTNPHTRGIRPSEVRRLFPGCRYVFHRITLSPPIARRLVPVSWLLCALLEKLRLLNTHYLASIQPM